jgi:hypothetical protein
MLERMVNVAQTITFLICIRDVPGSELDEAPTFLTVDFRDFPQFPPSKFHLELRHEQFFSHAFLFIQYHPIVRHYGSVV